MRGGSVGKRSGHMTVLMTAGEREHTIRWMEEGKNVLGNLLVLLEEYDRLKASCEAGERECERLRGELNRLQGDLERERKEREEIAQWLSEFMGDAVSRLRGPR